MGEWHQRRGVQCDACSRGRPVFNWMYGGWGYWFFGVWVPLY